MTETNENEKVPNPKEKKGTITTVIIIIGVIAAGIYLFWDYFLGVKPDITINGTKISIDNSVQDIYDTGFVLCSVTGEIKDPSEFTVTAKEIYNSHYYIGIPHEGGVTYCDCSGVEITVANYGNSDKLLKDCTIYEITYHPGDQDDPATVLVNEADLKDASIDEWLEFFETTGYPFKKEDMDKFRSGDKALLFGTRGKYKFEAGTESVYHEECMKLTITHNVKTTYK